MPPRISAPPSPWVSVTRSPRMIQPKAAVAHAPMTVLVADFSNHTGDPLFDGTLEPVVKMALEGAAFITAYDEYAVTAFDDSLEMAGHLLFRG